MTGVFRRQLCCLNVYMGNLGLCLYQTHCFIVSNRTVTTLAPPQSITRECYGPNVDASKDGERWVVYAESRYEAIVELKLLVGEFQ